MDSTATARENTRLNFHPPEGSDSRIEFAVLLEGEGRGVLYNATIDRIPPTVNRRWASHVPWVPEGSIGLQTRLNFSQFPSTSWLPDLLIAFRSVRRGADARGATLQAYATGSHVYGVFNVSAGRRL